MRALGMRPSDEQVQQMVRPPLSQLPFTHVFLLHHLPNHIRIYQIASVDADKSGKIEFPEFLELMATRPPDTNTLEDELRDAFTAFDVDGSGLITADELKHVMGLLGMHEAVRQLS